MTESNHKARGVDTEGRSGKRVPIQLVQRGRLSDEILVRLTKLITDRVFEPGDRLPPERELALQFGVNRASLREALRKMEAMGLVFIRQGGGIFVQDHNTQAGIDFVLFILKAGIDLDKGLFMDIARIRDPFMQIMLSFAAENITPESIERLEEIVRDMAQADPHTRMSGRLDFAFFVEIAKASGNRIFVYILNSIRDILERMVSIYQEMDDIPNSDLTLFKGMIEALRQGDGKRAHALFSQRARVEEERLAALLNEVK